MNNLNEEVFWEYYDSAGNYVWYGTQTGKHIISTNGMTYINTINNFTKSRTFLEEEQKNKALSN